MSKPSKKRSRSVRSEISTPGSEVGIMPMDLTIRGQLSIMMFLQ